MNAAKKNRIMHDAASAFGNDYCEQKIESIGDE